MQFDTSSYKIGDTVTVTLNDVDLNTHSETIEVYTTSASTTEDLDGNAIFDRVGTVSADITNVAHGRLLDITFDDTVWSSYNCGVSPNGISDTGFTLSETNATSGIFTGTFQIPSNYCTSTYENKTTTGKDMDINYVDFLMPLENTMKLVTVPEYEQTLAQFHLIVQSTQYHLMHPNILLTGHSQTTEPTGHWT